MVYEDDLVRVDRALLRLRRMWDAPAGIQHGGTAVEGSTLMVCLAVEERLVASAEAGVVDVAEALRVTQSTGSRLVTRAVSAGMVVRRDSRSDPRRASLALTAAGRDLVAASRAYRTSHLGDLLTDWSARDVAALADLLARFAAAVTDTATPPEVTVGHCGDDAGSQEATGL